VLGPIVKRQDSLPLVPNQSKQGQGIERQFIGGQMVTITVAASMTVSRTSRRGSHLFAAREEVFIGYSCFSERGPYQTTGSSALP
jgi:hypothetical protein